MKAKTRRIIYICFLLVFAAGYLYVNYGSILSAETQTVSQKEVQPASQASVPDVTALAEQPPVQTFPEAQTTATVTVQKALVLGDDIQLPVCPSTTGAGVESGHEFRSFSGYTICYREEYEQPEWAAYTLTGEKLVKNASRKDNFRPDPEISTGSASLADYKGSGYDRGHLAPAADFSYSEDAMSGSFYLSNMSPQNGSFNRGIWAKLEAAVRDWAGETLITYVVTGPVLEKPANEYGFIGANEVSVPEYYYKALLFVYEDNAKVPAALTAAGASSDALLSATTSDGQQVWLYAAGYLLPNEKSGADLASFMVSIDDIEARTGLDFFSLLPDVYEDALEVGK